MFGRATIRLGIGPHSSFFKVYEQRRARRYEKTRYDVTRPPHKSRSTNRQSVPSLNSIALGTAGIMF